MVSIAYWVSDNMHSMQNAVKVHMSVSTCPKLNVFVSHYVIQRVIKDSICSTDISTAIIAVVLVVIFDKLFERLMMCEDNNLLSCVLCQLGPQPFSLDLVLLNSSIPLEPRNVAVVIHATNTVVYHITVSKRSP